MLSQLGNTILDTSFLDFNFYNQFETERIDNIQKKNTNNFQTYMYQQRQHLIVGDVPVLSQLENTILDTSFLDFNFYN